MEQIYQMEYRGLNLLDEISTVELAIDEKTCTLHIFDVAQVVSPIYNFDLRKFELSEGFYKMGDVLRNKRILTNQEIASHITLNEWIARGTFYFYVPKKAVKKYVNGQLIEVVDKATDANNELNLFEKYKQKIK